MTHVPVFDARFYVSLGADTRELTALCFSRMHAKERYRLPSFVPLCRALNKAHVDDDEACREKKWSSRERSGRKSRPAES